VQRVSGVDVAVLSEIRDGGYRFAGLEAVPAVSLIAGQSTIPFESSLCSRVHLGLAPSVVPEMQDEAALWEHWLELEQGLGVDWDIRRSARPRCDYPTARSSARSAFTTAAGRRRSRRGLATASRRRTAPMTAPASRRSAPP
jgi:hypothetical protein